MPSWPSWALLPGDVLQGAGALDVSRVIGARLGENGLVQIAIQTHADPLEDPALIEFDREDEVEILPRPEDWWMSVPAWSVLIGDEVAGFPGPVCATGAVHGGVMRLVFRDRMSTLDPLSPVLVRRGELITKARES
jgi:hypothetical protein